MPTRHTRLVPGWAARLLLLAVLGMPSAGMAASAPSPAMAPSRMAAASGAVRGPAPGPLRIIGGGINGGCIAGAVRLPPQGPGFQTIHLDRSSFWGAPVTIAGLEQLAREAAAAGFPTLLVEDISRDRGGPMAPHVAHQVGLDADVALDMRPRPPLSDARRETVVLRNLVRADGRGVDGLWSGRVAALLKMAADLPGVDRILVNPAIKRHLCRTVTGDRSWLRRIRPWWGHEAHMHIHFKCPAGQAACVSLPRIPPGDGCNATLDWWFAQLGKPAIPARPHKPRVLPAACRAILGGVPASTR